MLAAPQAALRTCAGFAALAHAPSSGIEVGGRRMAHAGSDTSAPAAPGGAPHAGGEDLRAAAQDMRAAAEDAWSVVGTVRTSFAALSPTILAFLRDRVDTLRTALAEFMQGYTEGVREV